jgi:AraC-like DNA-binding protein
MAYQSVLLKDSIVINRIVSCHYFQYMSNFYFPGEMHDFWEFVFVDGGEVDVLAGTRHFTLKRGNILFHKPMEFHNVMANGKVSPSLVVISFVCHSRCIRFFEEKLLSVQDTEENILAKIISEARSAFRGRMDDPYQEKLIPVDQENMPFGTEQLIRQYLQELLILLYRRYHSNALPLRTKFMLTADLEQSGNETFTRIVRYMGEHISEKLSVKKICRDNLIGQSQLEKLFREEQNCGVIDYFLQMKIGTARKLIRNNQMSFTEISDHLGYSSVHYFSRQFKKIARMSPSVYAKSVQSLAEKNRL